MPKLALLIGVSEYTQGLNPLPAATKDVAAIQRVLLHPEMGNFDNVQPLINPESLAMQEAIENLFANRQRDDLVLLFFSGHGIKDSSGKLYFATRLTRKTSQGELVKASAVPASFVHDIMSNSRSRHQVIILDCCFSGAFAENLLAKDDGSINVKNQLGGEGRVVLTSSTSTQYSFEQKGTELSIYTQYLVEGIETGAADSNSDGAIAVDELHNYAKQRVQATVPAMKPEIYAVKEGFKILLVKAGIRDPQLRYQKEVERVLTDGNIFPPDRRYLDELSSQLGISQVEAHYIEIAVLETYKNYQNNLEQYKQIFLHNIKRESTLSEITRHKLNQFIERWQLKHEDVLPIENQIIQQLKVAPISENRSNSVATFNAETSNIKSQAKSSNSWIGVVIVFIVLSFPLTIGWGVFRFVTSIFPEISILQEPEITQAEYEAVKYGMTYEEVVKIIGSPGTENGGSKLISDTIITNYKWKKGFPKPDVTMRFENNRLSHKGMWW
ncbi:caspase family protein [Nostoc sp. LEGE 06077]|uniref:caspase, EACC1-associated type n=1 Tax=Nostoc sp. LEGE 06077 TaxID=915325 RepID=UPI00187F8608|nr:caspase family protein [Nostoc sp. LEGE 06077]MBE9208661.1 caspase family protein [Nostoc sp. LEGE 06077]